MELELLNEIIWLLNIGIIIYAFYSYLWGNSHLCQ